MRISFLLCLALGLPGVAVALTIGSTYEMVVAEKGPPVSKLTFNDVTVLKYADIEVRLEGGKVVSFVPARTEPVVQKKGAGPAAQKTNTTAGKPKPKLKPKAPAKKPVPSR